MPALQHWFTGGAVAAFLVVLTAGYAWYRAALSEQDAAITKQTATAQKLKTEQTREALQRFYMEVGSIIAHPLPKDISEEGFQKYEKETDEWLTRTANWINQNMGVAAMARFLDRTGLNAVTYSNTINEKHNTLLMNLTRFRQNVLVLLENPAWGEPQQ